MQIPITMSFAQRPWRWTGAGLIWVFGLILILMSSGRLDAQTWKTNANARIEQYRKRDVRLEITSSNGLVVPGTVIQVRQSRHQFAFGTAINGNVSNPQYAAFVKSNFEWAVMENESKWYANEPSKGNVTYTAADTLTNFCFANGITLRGHCLFWAVDANVQSWVTNLSNANLLVALTNRLNSAVNHFKGTFGAWDVNNEMLHGNYYGNRLGNWVNPWMFQYVRTLDPNLQLFVNDYNVISYSETSNYRQQILSLLASNAPVGGIGCQGHFGATVDPATTESRIDMLAQPYVANNITNNIPIWITEYDSLNADENVRADNLETLYRIAFSKPAVDGVLMWGFWAGSQWRGSNAAIVNLDWTVNAAGRRYQSLLAEWTTVTNGVADATGNFTFRGFHGSYDITLTPPSGVPTLRKMTLGPGAGTNVVTFTVPTIGPAIGFNPARLEAQCLLGQNAGDVTLTVSNAGTDTLIYSLASAATWLSVTPTTGSSTGQPVSHNVNFVISNLPPGNYFSWITISNTSATPVAVNVPVTVQVLNDQPTTGFSPPHLATITLPGQNAQSISFNVFNAGIGSLNYTLSNGAPWVAVTPTSGSSTGPADPVWHTLSFITSNLPPGAYTTWVSISAPSQPVTYVPVALRVMAGTSGTGSSVKPCIAYEFNEGSGMTSTNTGSLGGAGLFTINNGFPVFTNAVVTGPFAPLNNVGCVDFGPYMSPITGQSAIQLAGNLGLTFSNGFTVSGWLNCRTWIIGYGGNRIVACLDNNNGKGFDLVQSDNGSLRCGINQWSDGSNPTPPVTANGVLPLSSTADPTNWVFFAVTFNPFLTNSNLSYFIGKSDVAATLLTNFNYKGNNAYSNVGITNAGPLSVGCGNTLMTQVRGTSGTSIKIFRGLMDNIEVYDRALSADEIQAVQIGAPPSAPEIHLDSLSTNFLLLSWGGANAILEEATNVTGPWLTRTNQSGAQLVKPAGTKQFFRLR
jgi:GH35 family endo-1,4-beta-xylanase